MFVDNPDDSEQLICKMVVATWDDNIILGYKIPKGYVDVYNHGVNTFETIPIELIRGIVLFPVS